MGSKASENPLISHARMRALYRGLVQARLLASTLGRERRLPHGLEACWVGTAIDLREGDLTSDRRGTAAAGYLRALGAGTGAGSVRDIRRLAGSLPLSGPSGFERLLCAAGAATAFSRARSGVVVAYAGRAELSRREWTRLFALSGRGSSGLGPVPLVVVVTPEANSVPLDLEALAAKAAADPHSRMPVIAVDAGDTLAIYRVAQESVLRARSGGGAVVIDCAPRSSDPLRLLREQLVAKRVCTAHWCAQVAESFSRLLDRA